MKLFGVCPSLFRLDHDARDCIHDHNRGIRDAQRAARFLNEVAEAGGVEDVDLGFVPLAKRELGRDGDFPFDFVFIVIRRGISLVYTPKAVGRAGIKKNCGNQ